MGVIRSWLNLVIVAALAVGSSTRPHGARGTADCQRSESWI